MRAFGDYNTVCHANYSSPTNPKVRPLANGPDRSSHSSCKNVAALYQACGHQLGKQTKTDNRSGPHSIPGCVEGQSRPPISHTHTVIAISVGVRVRPVEEQGWRRFTELLCFDMYLMSRPGYASCECLCERRKQKTYISLALFGVSFRLVCMWGMVWHCKAQVLTDLPAG